MDGLCRPPSCHERIKSMEAESRPKYISGAYDDVLITGNKTVRGICFSPHDSSAELTVYDQSTKSASGVILYIKGSTVVTSLPSIKFSNGMYVVMTGANSKCVFYV